MGAFISLMSSSFAYEDPLIRQQQQAIGAISTTAKAREIFGEMGRGMWRSGKGFAKVTVLFAGTECVIESVSFLLLPRGIRLGGIYELGPDVTFSHCSVSSRLLSLFRVGVSRLRFFFLSDEYPCMRSIGPGMTSGIQSRLGLSPEAS
jgi:hypothetical protein